MGLHRFIVQQRVDQQPVRARVVLVHHALTRDAGARHPAGPDAVRRHAARDDQHELGAIAAEDDHQHRAELDRRRHHGEHARAQQVAQAIGAALDLAHQRPGVALRMEARAHRQQVGEGPFREAADHLLAHAREGQVAQLGEQRARVAQQRVSQQQPDRHAQSDRERGSRRGARRGRLRRREVIDDGLEHRRHAHRRDLGEDQQRQREQRAAAPAPQRARQSEEDLARRRRGGEGRRRSGWGGGSGSGVHRRPLRKRDARDLAPTQKLTVRHRRDLRIHRQFKPHRRRQALLQKQRWQVRCEALCAVARKRSTVPRSSDSSSAST